MSTLVLGSAEVRRLLPMSDCIEAMEGVLRAHARGRTALPLRTVVKAADRGSLYVMPAWTAEPESLAVKLITLFPGNAAAGRETHQGVVALFGADGGVEALIEGGSLTGIRTAAVSGAATRALSRPDSKVLAILGSGVQARTHLEAMCAVRPIGEVRVWSRTKSHAERFAREASSAFGVDVRAAGSAEDAVRGADIVCTVTGSPVPVLLGDWLAAGAHVNAVGASTPSTRELDSQAMTRARIYVDSRESAMAEAGDLLIPLREGAIGADAVIGEIGEVLTGAIPGRTRAEEITVFESLGLAIEDAAAARLLADRAAVDPRTRRLELE